MEEMETDIPIIILDLLAPFLDENIQPREIDRLFKASAELIQNAMQAHFILIGVKPIPQRIAPARMGLLKWVEKDFGLLCLSESGMIRQPEPDLSQPTLF